MPTYPVLGYRVVLIPRTTVAARVEFVLGKLGRAIAR